MNSDTKAVSASRLRKIFGASTLICAAFVAAPAAQAQFFPGPFSSGPFSSGPFPYGPFYAPYARPIPEYRPGPFLSPPEVFEEVISAGYQPVRLMGRNGRVFIVDAKDKRGQPIRLIVDAMDGDILERFPQGSAPKAKQAHRVDDPAAKTPVPPRRPATALPNGANPSAVSQPPVAQAPAIAPPRAAAPQKEAVARRPNDWAPINSVPPAPLD